MMPLLVIDPAPETVLVPVKVTTPWVPTVKIPLRLLMVRPPMARVWVPVVPPRVSPPSAV